MATTALMSGIEFDALPYEEGRNWELLGGELIPMPSPTFEHQLLVQRLQMVLMLHFTANPNQGLSVSDVEFALGKDHRMRPDVLILLAERLASVDIEKVPVPGAPDIAVEVISPSERAVHTQAKLESVSAPRSQRSVASLSEIQVGHHPSRQLKHDSRCR